LKHNIVVLKPLTPHRWRCKTRAETDGKKKPHQTKVRQFYVKL